MAKKVPTASLAEQKINSANQTHAADHGPIQTPKKTNGVNRLNTPRTAPISTRPSTFK
jgi:hypothetical protein